jgi:hypothetical protein
MAFLAAALPLIAGAGAGTAAALAQKSAADDAAKESERLIKEQEAKQAELEKQLTDRTANEESQASLQQAQVQARNRQRMRARGAGGRASTILTSPLGIVDEGTQEGSAGKTLLGL